MRRVLSLLAALLIASATPAMAQSQFIFWPGTVFPVNGLAATSTDGVTLANLTPATAGVTVQMSPRVRLRGNAWDTAASQTVDFFTENLPATAATPTGTWKLGYSLNGAAATYPLTVSSAGQATLLAGVTIGAAAGVTGTCDTPTFTGGVATTCGGSGGSVDGTYFVASNFTTDGASTALNVITGLQWTFPASTAINVPFRCSFWYSQATAVVADSFGFQDVTVAPTNLAAGGSMETALGTTAYGDLTASSTTTATAIVTATPSAINTIWNAYIDGMIEQPSNGSSSLFKIMVKTATAADVITVYRGSYCKVG